MGTPAASPAQRTRLDRRLVADLDLDFECDGRHPPDTTLAKLFCTRALFCCVMKAAWDALVAPAGNDASWAVGGLIVSTNELITVAQEKRWTTELDSWQRYLSTSR